MTETTRFSFQLPVDRDTECVNTQGIGLVLAAFPNRYSHLDGNLTPPSSLLLETRPPQVAHHTGWRFAIHETGRHIIPALLDGQELSPQEDEAPEVVQMLCREPRLHPRRIVFDHAGYLENGAWAFPNIVEIAAHYVVNMSYIGWIRLVSQVHGWRGEVRASVSMQVRLNLWQSRRQSPAWQPPCVVIEFNPAYGGTQAMIEPMLAICQRLWAQATLTVSPDPEIGWNSPFSDAC